MNSEPKTLTEDEIPQEVIDDLKKHFKSVSIELNKGIDQDTRSMKSNYFSKDKELTKGVVIDTETFEPILYLGYAGKSYLVRLNKIGDSASIRQVIEKDIFDPIERIDNLETLQDESVK